MMVVGPFVESQQAGVTMWRPPAGHVGAALDLSPQASARLWDPTIVYQPMGLFWIPRGDMPANQSEYRAFSHLGSPLGRAAIDFLLQCGGKRDSGLTLGEWITAALTTWAEPDDTNDRWLKVVVPPTSREWEIFVGTERLSGVVSDLHRSRLLRLHQRDMVTAASVNHEHAGKWLAMLLRKYGLTLSEFIAGEPRLSGLEPRHPRTTISESFDKADSGTLGPDLTWVELSDSTAKVVGNKATCEVSANNSFAYAQSALSSADHAARGVVGNPLNGNGVGTLTRKSDDSNKTFYLGYQGSNVTDLCLFNGGSYTAISNAATGTWTGTITLDSSGSSHQILQDGSQIVSGTNATISSGSYCGIYLYDGGIGAPTLDNWEASDDGFSPAGCPRQSMHLRTQGIS